MGGGKIRVIRNSHNIGANPSRKIGVDNARGQYITFIDGDDWLEPNTLEVMVESALKYNIDYVVINAYRCYPLGIKKKIKQSISQYNIPIYQPQILDDYFISFFGINKINVAYWGKLIKTEIIRQSKFAYNNFPIGEDLLFNIHLFPTLNSIVFLDCFGYNWRFGGITSSEMSISQTKKVILYFIELYRIKSKKAKEINYEKAYRPMIVELKNILLSNFSFIAKYKPTDARSIDVKKLIIEILNISDYHNNISSLLQYERYKNDLFIIAVSNKDIETIYNICYNSYRRNWKKRFLKRILHLIK